jgi:hypothetical protein
MEEKLKQLEKQLQIEMNAKNKAYYFILSQGLFREFADFSHKFNSSLDAHGACLAELALK